MTYLTNSSTSKHVVDEVPCPVIGYTLNDKQVCLLRTVLLNVVTGSYFDIESDLNIVSIHVVGANNSVEFGVSSSNINYNRTTGRVTYTGTTSFEYLNIFLEFT